jgi:alpha-glucosidase
VWRDPRPDGSPPNNWQSVFGGSAWEFDTATGQYYLHSFLREQPDLDWRNPEVVEAMHGVLRFWLDRGVDGFRIDVIQRIAKDPALRDNPLIPGASGYGGQRHVHDENHPDVHALLRGIRGVLDRYPERMAVGEVYLMDPVAVAGYYGEGDELHLGFNFSFLRSPWSAPSFRYEVERFERALAADAWPNLVLSNHDVPRHATRYDDPAHGEARARVAAVLLLALRGTPFLYYGEEIGMRNVEIPVERMQDPLARTLHPKLSRDGERTPMQWRSGAGAGFTTGAAWLPFAPDADRRNVEAQRADRRSLLWLYRDLIALRRRTPALERGSFRALDAPDGVFAWERRAGDSCARVAANFGGEPREVNLGGGKVLERLSTRTGPGADSGEPRLPLAPNEAVVRVLAASA